MTDILHALNNINQLSYFHFPPDVPLTSSSVLSFLKCIMAEDNKSFSNMKHAQSERHPSDHQNYHPQAFDRVSELQRSNKSVGHVLNSLEITQSRFTLKVDEPIRRRDTNDGPDLPCLECRRWQEWAKQAQNSMLLMEKDLIQKEQSIRTLILGLNRKIDSLQQQLKEKAQLTSQIHVKSEQSVRTQKLVFGQISLNLRPSEFKDQDKKVKSSISPAQVSFSLNPSPQQRTPSSLTTICKVLQESKVNRELKEVFVQATADLNTIEEVSEQNRAKGSQKIHQSVAEDKKYKKKLSKSYLTSAECNLDSNYLKNKESGSSKLSVRGHQSSHPAAYIIAKSRANQTLTDCSYIQAEDGDVVRSSNNQIIPNSPVGINPEMPSKQEDKACSFGNKGSDASEMEQMIQKLKFDNENLKAYNKVLLEKLSNSKPRKY